MDAAVARSVARRIHAGQLTRSGEPVIDHVERVAHSVPACARPMAYLHDVLERADGGAEELLELGLTDEESSVLALLTRARNESYRAYVMRIARADGQPGEIARTIKLADLDDHLRHHRNGSRTPNYAWARQKLVASQRTNRGTPAATSPSPSGVTEPSRDGRGPGRSRRSG